MKVKTKRCTIRLEQPLIDFITTFAKKHGMTTSEIIRDVLIYFHLGLLTGDIQKSLPQIKKDFLKMDLKKYNLGRKKALTRKSQEL